MIDPRITRRLVSARDGGAQLHGSTILPTEAGTLVAWFEGAHEGAPDTRIRLARADADETFGPAHDVTRNLGEAQWNPVLASGQDGAVWLFFKVGDSIADWRTYVSVSHDASRGFSEPRELVPGDRTGGRGPVRQAPVRFGDLWIAPGSVEVWEPHPQWDCFVDVSHDTGASWRKILIPLDHEATAGAGCIQPVICLTRAGGLVALTRSTAGRVFRSTSVNGTDWSPLEPTSLPNNNSGISAATLVDGRIVCVHNPGDDSWGPRSRLALSISRDDGRTWHTVGDIEDGSPVEGAPAVAGQGDGTPVAAAATGVVTDGAGEYSYPSLNLQRDQLLVSYTWQRAAIIMAQIPLSTLNTG